MHIGGMIWFPAIVAALLITSSCTTLREPVVGAEFDFQRNQIVLTAALPDDGEYQFLLDSAVDPSVIDSGVAARFGFVTEDAPVGEAEGVGDGAGLAIRPAIINGLSIDGTEFEEFLALSADLTPFSDRLEFDLAGILGYSFLADRVTRIDYKQRRVDIARNIDALPPIADLGDEQLVTPLRFMSAEDLIPVIEIHVGDATITVSVDTGSSQGVELYDSAVALLGLEEDRNSGEKKSILGARGEAEVSVGDIESVGIGPFVVKNAPATFSSRKHDPTERMGNVGNAFLENFVLTLDYVDKRIIFQVRQ